MQECHPGGSGGDPELLHDRSAQRRGAVLQGGGRRRDVTGQQVRSGLLQGQLGEHREQRALPGRGADRLAGQPVVLQRETGSAPVEVVGRPDGMREGIQGRGGAGVSPVHLGQPDLGLLVPGGRQQERELEQLPGVGFGGGVAEPGQPRPGGRPGLLRVGDIQDGVHGVGQDRRGQLRIGHRHRVTQRAQPVPAVPQRRRSPQVRVPELRAAQRLQLRPQERREHLVQPEPLARAVDLVDEQVICDHPVQQPAGVLPAGERLAEPGVELLQDADARQEAGQGGGQPTHHLAGQVVARLPRRGGEGVDHLARVAACPHHQHGHLQPGRPALGQGAKPPPIDGLASQARQLEQLLDLDLGERQITGPQLGDNPRQPQPGGREHRVVLAGHQQTDMAGQLPGQTCQRSLRRLRELSVIDDHCGRGRQVRQVTGERVHQLRLVPRRPLQGQRRVTAHRRPPRGETGGEPGPEPGRLPAGFIAG